MLNQNHTKHYGQVGKMYIATLFKSSQQVTLSKNINDACNLDEESWPWLKDNLNVKIIKVTVNYEEL